MATVRLEEKTVTPTRRIERGVISMHAAVFRESADRALKNPVKAFLARGIR
jgi:hypothetical protein